MNTDWKSEIIKAVSRCGGINVPLSEIYREMINIPIVTDRHLQPWKGGGQPRYQCWIRRCLTDLVREGLIIRPNRGKYSLSD